MRLKHLQFVKLILERARHLKEEILLTNFFSGE